MILKPYIKQSSNIKPLFEFLPMAVPFSIWIEPTNKCNFRCIFCPTGNNSLLKKIKRPSGFMDYDLYLKIVKDIEVLCCEFSEKVNRLHLYKDGEPMLHEKIHLMVLNAKKIKTIDSVEITTNASLLTPTASLLLIESGLDFIRISVEHVNNSGYERLTRTKVKYEDIRKNVEFLFKEKNKRFSNLHVYVKIIDTGLSKVEKDKFLSDFSCISDSVNIDSPMGWSMSFEKEMDLDISNIETGMSGLVKKKGRKICPEPFSKLAVNFNGTVSVCCADWSHGTLVGDLKKESLIDIWHGEKLKAIRLMHIEGKRRQIASCCDCDYMKGFSDITDLDNYSNILMDKYK